MWRSNKSVGRSSTKIKSDDSLDQVSVGVERGGQNLVVDWVWERSGRARSRMTSGSPACTTTSMVVAFIKKEG